MYGVKNVNSIYVIRFLIGLFESSCVALLVRVAPPRADGPLTTPPHPFTKSFYPGMQFLMGSFYRSDELAKRAIIFHTSGGIGRLFSGILQGAHRSPALPSL